MFSHLLPPQFIFLDLETTGLSAANDEIIEIAAIRFTPGLNDHPGFQALVKPELPIPPFISRLTGITQKMVEAEGVALPQAMASLLAFIGDLPLVTYNAPFDLGFLREAARRCHLTFSNPYTCALKCTKRAWPELKSHKLANVAKVMGYSSDQQHRALADCQVGISVFMVSTLKLNQKVLWTKHRS